LVAEGNVELHLSPDIIAETLAPLMRNLRAQANDRCTPEMAEAFCAGLFDLAAVVDDPPPLPGAVPRDPDDDKIIACALAAAPKMSLAAIVTCFRSALTPESRSSRRRRSCVRGR
jgi:hypothetical protein